LLSHLLYLLVCLYSPTSAVEEQNVSIGSTYITEIPVVPIVDVLDMGLNIVARSKTVTVMGVVCPFSILSSSIIT